MPTVFVKRMDEEKKHPFFIAGSQQLLDEVKIHPAFASRGRLAIGELTIGGDGFPLQEDMVFTWYPPAGRSAHEAPPGGMPTPAPPTPAPATILEYPVSPLDFTSMKFDAKLPEPIRLAAVDAARCRLVAIPEELKGVITISSQCDELAVYATKLITNDKTGTSQDALHGRDDAIMHIIMRVSGGMQCERNKESTSTAASRLDSFVGSPPMVLIEEKADQNELRVAVSEIHDKFQWVPQYEHVPFVIGIAIAGDFLKMEAISRQGVVLSTQVYNLARPSDAIRVLQAAVNVGRLCRHVVTAGLLQRVSLAFNVVHRTPRRVLEITFKAVEKTYLGMDGSVMDDLISFYSATAEALVPFIERAEVKTVDKIKKRLKLTLTPVGLERKPINVNEAKVALKCILLACSGCHKLGWTLNDLRWPNIIMLQTRFWSIIDCEYARRIDAPLPQELKVRCDWTSSCSASTDLYLIGRLLADLDGHCELDVELRDLKELLLSKSKCFDLALTAQRVLDDHAWLLQATPTASPQGARGQASTSGSVEPPAKVARLS